MAVKDRDSNSSSIFLSYGDVFEDEEHSIQKRGTRQKLHRCLNRILVHTAIVVIVLVQVLVITFLLLIHFQVIQDPQASTSDGENTLQRNTTSPGETETDMKESAVEKVEDTFNAINIVIFSLFVIEILLRVVAKGSSIFEDKLQLFDGGVVLFVCLVYIALLAANADRNVVYGLGYLIILRLWRIGRIYQDITEGERRKSEQVINTHRKAAKDAERYARSMMAKVEQLQYEIITLQEHGKVFPRNDTSSSPALRSVSRHTHTPDDNGNYAYNNMAFQPDTESLGQLQGQSQDAGQPRAPNEESTKSKYDELGSTTYLNQDGIPMTDL